MRSRRSRSRLPPRGLFGLLEPPSPPAAAAPALLPLPVAVAAAVGGGPLLLLAPPPAAAAAARAAAFSLFSRSLRPPRGRLGLLGAASPPDPSPPIEAPVGRVCKRGVECGMGRTEKKHAQSASPDPVAIAHLSDTRAMLMVCHATALTSPHQALIHTHSTPVQPSLATYTSPPMHVYPQVPTWLRQSLWCESCRGQLSHPAALTVAQQAVQLQPRKLGAGGGNLKATQLLLTAVVWCGVLRGGQTEDSQHRGSEERERVCGKSKC